MALNGHGGAVSVRSFLPVGDERQGVTNVRMIGEGFRRRSLPLGPNTLVEWASASVEGHRELGFTCLIRPLEAIYSLPDSLPVPILSENVSWLDATELIQKDDPGIAALAERLGITTSNNAIDVARKAYSFASDSLASAKYSAQTDAVLALKLREASCNGKSRLMVALLRNRGIPSRLVGGLILEGGRKRTTHQWTEVLLGGSWVPFCPLNNHFATLPDRYVAFYRGDETMFERTANVNFKYYYSMSRIMHARDTEGTVSEKSLVNVLNLWDTFRRAGVSLDILRILLMIPLGAVVIIIFRNVIGIHTFGTFLPVLIATAYEDTGLLWGSIIFSFVILTGASVRWGLEKFRLLHSPKLTIILVSVIAMLIAITTVGIQVGNEALTGASLFPLAIMAITIERFSIIADTQGMQRALIIFLWTLVVVVFCYISMMSTFLQSVVMTFPETLLLIIAAGLYLGGWNHLRLSEFIRFRNLIFVQSKRETA
ncbi:MAG: transglutaminase [Chitinivibrionales bacterium]|nr:transglutaminase [Chitinivibrionales bacterium]